jgi:hypothetical protein
MRGRLVRSVAATACAAAAAALLATCGGGPSRPTPNPGGGGGGVVTPPNTPPSVTSITAASPRAEVGNPIALTATVDDAETPLDKLTYNWTAPTGTFAGTGRTVVWTPGTDAATPGDFTVTLTVIERYTSGSTTAENTATGTTTVHVNNSPKELAELSLRFLNDFANSKIAPEQCVREFSDSCRGKKDELEDIVDNRHDFEILSSTLRHTGLQIDGPATNATVHTACSFTSRVITNTPQSGGCKVDPASCRFGTVQTAEGDCLTTNVYEKGRWWICTSNFAPKGKLTAFARAFFGIR